MNEATLTEVYNHSVPVAPQLVLLHRYNQSQFVTVNVPNNLQLVGILQPRRMRQEVPRSRLKYLSPPQGVLSQRFYSEYI